ncbi:MAG: substrate-binding domain-containing protein [Verrucomicrobia bacterium]|nr:substrate-binding domain-containing protein [Verrucomicrobiota bacterium]
MNPHWAKIELVRTRSLCEQIREHVRNLVVTGRIEPGARLPSTHELARIWQTHLQTVQVAFAPLVREGLLMRVNRIGTFAMRRPEKLTRVGIYYSEYIWTQRISGFQQALHFCLKRLLNERNIETDVWIDPRPNSEQDQSWVALVKAAEQRKIQGLIVTSVDPPRLRWLNKLPVPIAHLSAANLPNSVHMDLCRLVELGLGQLARQGCRSVGLIAPMCPNPANPDGGRNVYTEFFEHFVDVARTFNLRIKNQWMCVAQHDDELQQEPAEHFGYKKLHNLWRHADRPEGLLVPDDEVAKGVITALLELNVRVPQELKLALHKNAEVGLLCPVPATFIVFSAREVARSLFDLVQKQFRGAPVELRKVGFTLAAAQPRKHRRAG